MAVKASWSRNFIHSFTPFHSPSIDKWLGQGASACPWPPGGHMVRECPSAANSLYISIPQRQVWTSKKIKAGASTGAPVLAHGHPGRWRGGGGLRSPWRPFHVVGSLLMEGGCLPIPWGFSHQLWAARGEDIIIQTWQATVRQAAACPVEKPNTQKEKCSVLWGVPASECSLTVLLLASTFLLFALMASGTQTSSTCQDFKADTASEKLSWGCSGMEGLRHVLYCWCSIIITLKSHGVTGRVWECCSFPGQHLVPITVNNLSPPSFPNPRPSSTFSTFYIKSTSNTFLPF